MDSSKNGRWIIPFKKFGMVRVIENNKMVPWMEKFIWQAEELIRWVAGKPDNFRSRDR